MNLNHKAVRIVVCGITETGKSTCVERIIRLYIARGKRVYIYDHQNEFAGRLNVEPIIDTENLLKAHLGKQKIICYDPIPDFGGDNETGFAFFCEWLYSIKQVEQSPCLLVADEFPMLCGVHALAKPVADLLVAGRRYGIDTIIVTHSMSEVHNQFRQNITELFFFRHGDKYSCEWPKYQGVSTDALLSLPTGVAIHLDSRTRTQKRIDLFGKSGRQRKLDDSVPSPPPKSGEEEDTPIEPESAASDPT